MKLKTKLFFSISSIVFIAVTTTLLAFLLVLNQGIDRHTLLLTEELYRQVHQHINVGNKILKNSITNYIDGTEGTINAVCKNKVIKKNIGSGQWKLISGQLDMIADNSNLEFISIFDKRGTLQASWPPVSDVDYYEKNYQKIPLFKKLMKLNEGEVHRNPKVLSMFDMWNNPAAKGYSVNSKIVLVSAGIILNDMYEKPIGYVLTGSGKTWLKTIFDEFHRTTGQFSILVNGRVPLLWSSFSNSKNNLKSALKLSEPGAGQDTFSTVSEIKLEYLEEEYHALFEPLLNLSSVQISSDLSSYGVVTGQSLSGVSKISNKIISQEGVIRENVTKAAFFIGISIILISLFVVHILGAKISEPIELAAGAAKKLASGEFPKELESTQVDETGLLAKSMNTIMGKLKAFKRNNENQLEALKESHERHSTILSSIKSGVLIIDENTHEIVDVNEAAQEMIGEEYEEIIGKVCHNFVCPAEKGSCPISDKGEVLADSEMTLLTGNGENIPILKTAVPITLGGRSCFLESFVDITKLKNAEDELIHYRDQLKDLVEQRTLELNESEVLFKTIFDSSPQAIILTELDAGKIVDSNDMFCDLSQFTKEELVGARTTDLSFFSDDERLFFIDTLRQAGSVDGFEMDCKAKDGSIVNTLLYAKTMKISEKVLIMTTLVNVTGRLKAEKALIESEEKYRSILDESSIGYYEVDLTGRFTFVSDAICEIMGADRDELMGLSYKEYTSEETAQKIFLIFNRIFSTGQMKKRFEYQVYIKNKNSRVLETSVVLLKDQQGEIIGFSGIVMNITEQRDLELQLQNVQKMEAIGTLAGGIAHDFNNILAAILGYAELAKLNSPDNPKVQNFLTQLCLASERARGLVKQILAFSRQSKVEKKPIDIGNIIKEALKLLRASIPSTIEIFQSVEENLGVVEADETQIHQIVMNLCANAFHAMEKDGGQLDISLIPVNVGIDEASGWQDIKPGPYLKFMVADTGHGMSSNIESRIFEPYFTTKDVGEGSGMGLATVHGIVKNHGGDIKVFSEQDAGTSFHILLPLIEHKIEAKVEESLEIPGGTERILFVDDEQFLIDIGKEFLEKLGYTVDVWPNPNEALDSFRKNPDKYDMVITDMTMPTMTGLKLASEVKKVSPLIPIILCTGYSKNITPESAIDMGINSILMKPLTLQKMAKTIRRVFENKH